MFGVKRKVIINGFLFLVQFLLIFYLNSCSEQKTSKPKIISGGTYRIPITSEITSLDPVSGQYYSWSIGSQIYEGLLTYSRDESKIIPLIAERYEKKGLSYIFHIRKGVKFHDDPCFVDGKGRELTCADVKYSFERNPLRDALGFEEFVTGKATQLEGLKVLDKYTFEIHLSKPSPDLLSSLASPGMFIIPKEAVDYYGVDFKLHPVGTGPFRFSELIPNEKLILVKNGHYWGIQKNMHLPYLNAVEYIIYHPDETEKMLLDFQSNRLDECTEDVAELIEDFAKLDERGNLKFKGWLKEKGIQYVKDRVFNKLHYVQMENKKVENEKEVRKAMSYAINRERLLETKKSPFHNYRIAKGPIPPDCEYFNVDIFGQYYDPEKALSLLQEAGYPNGEGLPELLFLSRQGEEFDLIVEDLRVVGFKIKKSDFFPGWRSFLISEKRQQSLLLNMSNTNTSNEAYSVLRMFLNQPPCRKDPAFVKAYEDWERDDISIRDKQLISRLEGIITDLSPVIFLYHIDDEFRFLQKYVRGRGLGSTWVHKFHYVWLDK